MSIRSTLAKTAGKATKTILEKTRSGGSSMPGKVALKLDPNILATLAKDYRTVIVTGSYRGDPLYNSVRVVGTFQTVTPASDKAPTTTEQTLAGETLLLAEVPEDGAVSTISDGFFIFIPEDQEAFKKVCEDHVAEDGHSTSANENVLIALKAQMWRATDINGSNPRMTSDTTFISVPRYDSMPGIVFEGAGS